jgi:predicted ester cyclase
VTIIETARTTMNSYVDSLIARGQFGQYFAPDVTLSVMGTDQEAHGADAVAGFIRYLHEQAFDAHPELKSLLVDGERAALELEFVGKHIADFMGKAATGKQVRVPYSVAYDLEGDRIKALRIYMPMDTLLRQLDG